MTEIILLVIAFELLMAMSLAVTCITIYVLGHKKQGEIGRAHGLNSRSLLESRMPSSA